MHVMGLNASQFKNTFLHYTSIKSGGALTILLSTAVLASVARSLYYLATQERNAAPWSLPLTTVADSAYHFVFQVTALIALPFWRPVKKSVALIPPSFPCSSHTQLIISSIPVSVSIPSFSTSLLFRHIL